MHGTSTLYGEVVARTAVRVRCAYAHTPTPVLPRYADTRMVLRQQMRAASPGDPAMGNNNAFFCFQPTLLGPELFSPRTVLLAILSWVVKMDRGVSMTGVGTDWDRDGGDFRTS
eukprot:1213696-Rhodomonas_salina.1